MFTFNNIKQENLNACDCSLPHLSLSLLPYRVRACCMLSKSFQIPHYCSSIFLSCSHSCTHEEKLATSSSSHVMPGDLRAARAPRLLSTCCLSLQRRFNSPTCFSSHVYCFWSRALFLSIKRCLAAVIESSVFRFETLTISAVESETKYAEAIDLKRNTLSTPDSVNRVQLT